MKKQLTDKKKLVTLSVGIPAYNEEGNIGQLISSVMAQKQSTFKLEQIIIALDGSTDKTGDVVATLAKEYKNITLVKGIKRRGKSFRLNQLYRLNQSDFLLTLDADILLDGLLVIEKLLAEFKKDKSVQVVAADPIPIKPKGFLPKVLYTKQLLWDEVRRSINNGDHIANLYGSSSLLKKSFSKSFIYPTNITCDDEFLYIMAKKKGGFRFTTSARVFYKPVATLDDLRLQGSRTLSERNTLIPYFGNEIIKLHDVAFKYKFWAIIKMFLNSPVYTLLAIFSDVWLRFFIQEDVSNKFGTWKPVTTTKSELIINS